MYLQLFKICRPWISLCRVPFLEAQGWVIPKGNHSRAEGLAEKTLFLRSGWRAGGGEGTEGTRFRGSALLLPHPSETPHKTARAQMLCLATLHPVEMKCWWNARGALALAPHQQETAHVCILYSRKPQAGPWPGDLFITSKIKALATFGTLPSPPFSRNHLSHRARITVNGAFQTKVWWSFINITR